MVLSPSDLTVRSQAFDAKGEHPTDQRTGPLAAEQLALLHAKFEHMFPLESVDKATVAVNYAEGQADVRIFYTAPDGAKKTHHERHNF